MSKQLKLIIQHPKDLILALVTADVLPASQILASHIWQRDSWCIRFHIIGASHRIRIEYQGRLVLEEMLACVNLHNIPCKIHHAFDDLQSFQMQDERYLTSVSVSQDASLWQSSADEIVYAFPAINGNTPLTKIQWQTDETQIMWRTLHTYHLPNQSYYVYSETMYQFQLED